MNSNVLEVVFVCVKLGLLPSSVDFVDSGNPLPASEGPQPLVQSYAVAENVHRCSLEGHGGVEVVGLSLDDIGHPAADDDDQYEDLGGREDDLRRGCVPDAHAVDKDAQHCIRHTAHKDTTVTR